MSARLYVGNLNYRTTDDTIREIFGEYGDITDVTVIEGKGFGFVEFDSESSAQEAIDGLNGVEVDGRQIRVDVARARADRGGGGGGGGYRGGGGGGGRRDRW